MTSLLRRLTLRSAAAAAVLCFATVAVAGLLGVVPGFPIISYENQNPVSTQISGGILTVNSTPQRILINAVSPPLPIGFVGGSPPVLTLGVHVDGACNYVSGIAGDDLVVTGTVDLGGGDVRSGTLLTGEVTAVGAQEAGATDVFDFRLKPTGGLLAPDFFQYNDIGLVLNVESSTFNGDCSVDSGGESKGTLGAIAPILPEAGCTPGYWKQKHHYDSWVGYDPLTTTVSSVFGPLDPNVDNLLLSEAMAHGGGGIYALMRQAVAALLNASSSVNYVSYPTPADVIAATQAAVTSGNLEDQKDTFEMANEAGCPLN